MLLHRDLAQARAAPRRSRRVAVVGYFDGLHLGHQRLLRDLERWGSELEAETAVVTFDRHPLEVLAGKAPLQILSLEHRLLLLERAGVDVTLALSFDDDLASWSPDEFATRVFRDALGAEHLLMGFDSAFGRGRQGTFAYVSTRAEEMGIEVRQAGTEYLGDERVSSTLVRNGVLQGDLPRLEQLLGRRFSLFGAVVAGDGRGRTLGFPTANLDVGGAAQPPTGVYFASASIVGDGEYPAVVNIGRRPTFEGATSKRQPVVEAHLLDYEGDLYGMRLELHFLKRHRDEQKFASPDALRQQIKADIEVLRGEAV